MKLSLALAVLLPSLAVATPSLWPMPASLSSGSSRMTLPNRFVLVDSLGNFNDNVKGVFERYDSLFFPHEADFSGAATAVSVSVKNPSADLQLESDESYTLTIPESSDSPIVITAQTQFGLYHAVDSLSQLISFDFDTESYSIFEAPISIADAPRFKHRGLLIDTSRHFLPLATLRSVIDSLTYAKLNVMHWHLVDSQSFPFEGVSNPQLGRSGSYSPVERYTARDVSSIVSYARDRGVRVMVEIDTPGHAASWCAGNPEVCPSSTCLEPLNVARNATFDLIGGLFKELTGGAQGQGLFPDNMMHLGGDEVNTDCWSNTPEIASWMGANGFDEKSSYAYFVHRVQEIAHGYGRDVVGWEEIWNEFGTALDPSTIVHQWISNSNIAPAVTAAGYRLLFSTSSAWYLDWLNVSWMTMYNTDPTKGVAAANEHLVLGGEGCMWGETVDTSDIMQTIWPRAAAIAERLWSPKEMTKSATDAEGRYSEFRCLLNRRGVEAAPYDNVNARTAPSGPGSCLQQRRAEEERKKKK